MNSEQLNNQPSRKPTIKKAFAALKESATKLDIDIGAESKEIAFLTALQGKTVREIGRYQVYSDYRKNETVVFIHEPTGRSYHKYIFAETKGRTYIVAAPTEWTEFHREILERVIAASGKDAYCPGGGYVSVKSNGFLEVDGSSGDFGEGNHAHAKRALDRAVRCTGRQHGVH